MALFDWTMLDIEVQSGKKATFKMTRSKSQNLVTKSELFSELAFWRKVGVFFGGNNNARLVTADNLASMILRKRSFMLLSFFSAVLILTPIVTCVLGKTGVLRIDD